MKYEFRECLIEYLFSSLYGEQDTDDIPYEIFKQNIIDEVRDYIDFEEELNT